VCVCVTRTINDRESYTTLENNRRHWLYSLTCPGGGAWGGGYPAGGGAWAIGGDG
jgi:hypothetical protein